MKKKHLYLLLPNGVVAPGVVVGSVLLASDHAAGVEEVSVCSCPDLIVRRSVKKLELSVWYFLCTYIDFEVCIIIMLVFLTEIADIKYSISIISYVVTA